MVRTDKTGSQKSQQDRNPVRQRNIAQDKPSTHLDNVQRYLSVLRKKNNVALHLRHSNLYGKMVHQLTMESGNLHISLK